ncbi:biotin transporter BioY [Pararhizobium sp.]|uniref:biotin transporter BioY n=1 Tax=Pararhizobium sp. TaxID=1977563 RepID=UPI002715F35B|nr:biotin transporter BioY [Pararhizobium sp.]MDO9416360.1 biotin transporter BioY [Pararhizobium sp.]
MSGLETAIRNALERSDRASAETRAKIYQSARQALEAGLRKQDVHDPDIIAQQRHRLEVTIRAIETEERAALKARHDAAVAASMRVESPAVGAEAAAGRGEIAGAAPSVSVRREPEAFETVPAAVAADDGLSVRPERRSEPRSASGAPLVAQTAVPVDTSIRVAKAPRRRRGRLLSLFLVASTLVAAIGVGAWWVETSGLLLTDAERDTSVANPSATVEAEDFSPEGLKTLGTQGGFSGDWTEVFKPGSGKDVETRGDATTDTISDESGQALRLISHAPDQNGEIMIPVPVAVLEQMSGKMSTIALTVRATGEKPSQFYVECEFSSLGKCGRHRFDAPGQKSDVLLKVSFDRSLAPSADGHLIINSDVSGAGNGLNLYDIRVLPGE